MGVSVALFLLLLLTSSISSKKLETKIPICSNFFEGSWVRDATLLPPYTPSSCPFIQSEFNCIKNGRPDKLYLQYQWQPSSCTLSRFDRVDFLRRFYGKRIMFVGDSLSRNQWQSLTCMLYASSTAVDSTISGEISTVSFTDYGIQVMLHHTLFLVDIVREEKGRILKLDSIDKNSKFWKEIDFLIFNTWHWWNRRGPSQPWDFIQVEGQFYEDMDRVLAFERAVQTWGKWVDTNVDPINTKVFFQGISPSHYNGTLWNEPTARSCDGEKEPVAGTTYPGGVPPALLALKRVLSTIRKPVKLLDITNLSLLRKDGHPSIYGLPANDCSHWCLPGVPDTWNQILYNLIL